jgi:hypothetical protein
MLLRILREAVERLQRRFDFDHHQTAEAKEENRKKGKRPPKRRRKRK